MCYDDPTFLCPYCNKRFPKRNKKIHEPYCIKINGPYQKPQINNFQNQNYQNKKQGEEIWTCNICKIPMNKEEKEDHLYAHQLDNQINKGRNRNDNRNLRHNYLNNQINSNNSYNRQRSPSPTFFQESNENNHQENEQFRIPNFPFIIIRRRTNNNEENINQGTNSNNQLNRNLNLMNSNVFFINFLNLIQNLNKKEHPTDKNVLDSLPTTKIEDVSKLDQEQKKCTICLEEYQKGEELIVLPCIHLFHKPCIVNWLKKQNSCPICKFKLTFENIQNQMSNQK